VIFESEVLECVPRGELAATISEMHRVSGGDLFASHNNVIDAAAYAASGERQPVRDLDVWRMRRMGVTARVAIAFPPFHNYEWIEFTDKAYDAHRSGSATS
jgi:hypothetical protein